MLKLLSRHFSKTTFAFNAEEQMLKRGDIAPRQLVNIRKTISPSYFTGRPVLHDTFYELDKLLKTNKINNQDSADELEIDDKRWVSKRVLETAWNIRVSVDEYRGLLERLTRLSLVETPSENAVNIIKKFTVPSHDKYEQTRATALDEWGRAYAIGYRRRIRAHVWLTEAKDLREGKIMVDGKDFVQVFDRFLHRSRVIAPFEVTDTLGNYNVWCHIENAISDPTGNGSMADAISNGIANALLVFNEELMEPLSQANLLEPCMKQRERKKPGQPGARAKFQWVKR